MISIKGTYMTQVDEPSTILSINYNNKADGFSKNE
jgi:hypothetical protein